MAQELRGVENRMDVTAQRKVQGWYFHLYTFLIDLEFDESTVMVSLRKRGLSALNHLLTTLRSQLSVTTLCSQLSAQSSLLKAHCSKLYQTLYSKLCARIQKVRYSKQVSAHSDRFVRKCLLSEQT